MTAPTTAPAGGPAGEPVEISRHRALGSPTRAAMLHLVRSSPDGLTAGEVAARTGLHLSTARDHLDRLVDAGMLVRERYRQAGRRGRPAWRYRSSAPGPAPSPYRSLAAALLDHLAPTPAAVEQAGRAWGRRLAAEEAVGAPVEVLRRVLDRLGFAPDVSAGSATGTVDLRLRACPFIELVHRHREAMCGLHQGVIRGVLEGAGADAAPAGGGDPRSGVDARSGDPHPGGGEARSGADAPSGGDDRAGGDAQSGRSGGEPVLVPFATPDACVVRLAAPRRPPARRRAGGAPAAADNRGVAA
ncbi:MAG: helix-turn-helix domain-containing protein [Micromonosporaceae bacterium]